MAELKYDWRKVAEDTKSDCSAAADPYKIEIYNNYAVYYDDDMVKAESVAQSITAGEVHKVLRGKYDARILDIGCGTGIASEELIKLGPYTSIEGLDPSQGMIDVAEKKNIFKKLMVQFFHLDCGISHNSYDVAMTTGTFIPGHLKTECLEEMCNIVKPGGYVVVLLREQLLYEMKLRDLADRLTNEKRWKPIEDKKSARILRYEHSSGKSNDGYLLVYQKI